MIFAADRGFEDKPDDYYPNNWRFAPLPAELWPTASNTPLQVPVMVGARLADKVQLRLEIAGLEEGVLAASINNRKTENLSREEDNWWSVEVPAASLLQGINQVGLSLQQPQPILPPPTVRSVEIHGTRCG